MTSSNWSHSTVLAGMSINTSLYHFVYEEFVKNVYLIQLSMNVNVKAYIVYTYRSEPGFHCKHVLQFIANIAFKHLNSPIRDILAIPLRLPQAITTATKKEELEIFTAMGAGMGAYFT